MLMVGWEPQVQKCGVFELRPTEALAIYLKKEARHAHVYAESKTAMCVGVCWYRLADIVS